MAAIDDFLESMQAPDILSEGSAINSPYNTLLGPEDESKFQDWVKQNKIPWQDDPKSDYDMRGFWRAQQQGDPEAVRSAENLHFPDTYKTPYHKTFSNESMYATDDAPHWEGYRLIDNDGNVVADETPREKRSYLKK